MQFGKKLTIYGVKAPKSVSTPFAIVMGPDYWDLNNISKKLLYFFYCGIINSDYFLKNINFGELKIEIFYYIIQ